MVETLILLVLNFLLGIGCMASVGWLAMNHVLFTLDGLFLSITCLILSLIFFLNCYWNLRSQELNSWLRDGLKNKEKSNGTKEANTEKSI